MKVLSLFLWCLAAACSAVCDTITHHFNRSVFSLIDNDALWWWFRSDWALKGNYLLGYDGYHTFKAIMIVCLVMAVIVFPVKFSMKSLYWASIFIVLWAATFELLYSWILLK